MLASVSSGFFGSSGSGFSDSSVDPDISVSSTMIRVGESESEPETSDIYCVAVLKNP